MIFIVVTPFCGTDYTLSLHFMLLPLIMTHWLTNQSICALTEMEKILTGKTDDDTTFFGKIVGPVYKFKTHKEEKMFVWTLLITLWFITFIRLNNTHFVFLRSEVARVRSML